MKEQIDAQAYFIKWETIQIHKHSWNSNARIFYTAKPLGSYLLILCEMYLWSCTDSRILPLSRKGISFMI